ncbi:cytochrome P450 4d2 isoform X1 [Spodoptera frugiperda]|uniref:Cytochrome P450 4d2 isoform X1 n=2 Tax=Spodoptera frugiperda TaxID=7108 RepID=A0A9R0DL68_SPOFR|nr:cytochrome P450 4d2 isoform X1 [Spodoptera frugiperda]
MFVWLLLLVFVLWMIVQWARRRHMVKLAAALPGPKNELPGLGIAHKFMGDTEAIMHQLQLFSYESMEKNGVLRGWLANTLFFIVVNPVDLEMVLKTCLEKDDLHRFIRKIIGNGGIFAPVSIWRRRRKILVPAFSPKIVENFVHVFAEQSEKLVRQLSSRCNGKEKFQAWPYLSTYTLDSVCETTIGVKINAQENPDSPFLRAMCDILNLICKRIFHLWLQPDWLFRMFPMYKKHQECIHAMHNFTDRVIESKREELKRESKSKTEVDNEFDLGAYKKQTFLDILIHLSGGENGYSNVELREEVLTLTVAGTDTSAVAIGFTLQLLGKYPEIQDKVYQELCEVFEDDRMLVKEDLMKLKYLERVVKESLRLFPPVPLIIRKVLEDITLPSGRVLPAGSGVACSIWGVHRDPKYWGPDAEKFDPDRFLPERFNLEHACSYMPFSNGPRNCVGYQYALMSIKTALSTILRKYRVIMDTEESPNPYIRVKIDIMMKAVDGYELRLEKREQDHQL